MVLWDKKQIKGMWVGGGKVVSERKRNLVKPYFSTTENGPRVSDYILFLTYQTELSYWIHPQNNPYSSIWPYEMGQLPRRPVLKANTCMPVHHSNFHSLIHHIIPAFALVTEYKLLIQSNGKLMQFEWVLSDYRICKMQVVYLIYYRCSWWWICPFESVHLGYRYKFEGNYARTGMKNLILNPYRHNKKICLHFALDRRRGQLDSYTASSCQRHHSCNLW